MQPSTTRCSKSSACASSRSARRTEKASCACRFPLNTARPVPYYNRDAFRRARLLGDARRFGRRGGGAAAALQAGAHALLALVALLVAGALVAFFHARLLFLLRGGRFLVFLVLRVGGHCGKGEANCSDHESHCGSSSSSRSMALTSLASSGSTRVP